MSNEICKSIEIIKEFPFFGVGDTLENRLRNVRLRGFPDVKIYENSGFELKKFSSEAIKRHLQTPQLNVYKNHLGRINVLDKLFQEEGIDILHLTKAYDFIATSESGKITEWTMIPPVVERFYLPMTKKGYVDYTNLIGEELRKKLEENGLGINQQVFDMKHPVYDGQVSEINDGSHRVHFGLLTRGVTVLIAEGMEIGFPYYAVPQAYSGVKELEKEDPYAPETKIHVVDAPGHKDLYRLFPSGGIMSGTVRFDPKLND